MEVIIIGAGGFAKQVIDVFSLTEVKIRGLVDDFTTGTILGYPIIGKVDSIDKNIKLFCAIGDVKIRREIYERFPDRWINCIHPTAIISKYSNIGFGNYIGPGATIMPNVTIGHNNIIDTLVILSHDCIIGNHNHIAGHSCLLGRVNIKHCNLIGANSTILPKINIESNSTLGAGAVLTKAIDSNKVLVGIPAKEHIKRSLL